MFRLSKRSQNNLAGVDERLVEVVELAIELTEIDFAVIEGVRTMARQKELVAAGKSWTLNSRHISGNAVDLMAYYKRKPCWEIEMYDEIADAMREAAESVGIPLRWGGAWHISDITTFDGTMERAHLEYIDLRRSQGKRPTIDGPHFERPLI